MTTTQNAQSSKRLPSDTGDELWFVDEAKAHTESQFYTNNGHVVSMIFGYKGGYGFDVYDLDA